METGKSEEKTNTHVPIPRATKKVSKPKTPKIAPIPRTPKEPNSRKNFKLSKPSGQQLLAIAFIILGILAFTGAIVGSSINASKTSHNNAPIVNKPTDTSSPIPSVSATPSSPKPTITTVPIPTPTATAAPLTSVTLGSVTLQIPANWTSTPAAGSQLAFQIPDTSGATQLPLVTFDDLGTMSSVSLPILSTAAQTISQTGATVGVPSVAKNGVGSFSAIEGSNIVEVRVVIVGGHGILVTLTLSQLDPAASTAVSSLVNTLATN